MKLVIPEILKFRNLSQKIVKVMHLVKFCKKKKRTGHK